MKESAEEYFNRIPDGHRNAIARPWNKCTDRSLRRIIEQANNNGDCIINVGDGIFRPIPGDPVDEKAFEEYIAKDLHRARAILAKRMAMKHTFEGWRNSALYVENKRKAERLKRVHSLLPDEPIQGGEPERKE